VLVDDAESQISRRKKLIHQVGLVSGLAATTASRSLSTSLLPCLLLIELKKIPQMEVILWGELDSASCSYLRVVISPGFI